METNYDPRALLNSLCASSHVILTTTSEKKKKTIRDYLYKDFLLCLPGITSSLLSILGTKVGLNSGMEFDPVKKTNAVPQTQAIRVGLMKGKHRFQNNACVLGGNGVCTRGGGAGALGKRA